MTSTWDLFCSLSPCEIMEEHVYMRLISFMIIADLAQDEKDLLHLILTRIRTQDLMSINHFQPGTSTELTSNLMTIK